MWDYNLILLLFQSILQAMNIVPITGEKPPTKIPEADMRLHEVIQSHKKTENAQIFSTKLETVSRKQKNARTQL